jgi:hypothetical protein
VIPPPDGPPDDPRLPGLTEFPAPPVSVTLEKTVAFAPAPPAAATPNGLSPPEAVTTFPPAPREPPAQYSRFPNLEAFPVTPGLPVVYTPMVSEALAFVAVAFAETV